MVLSTFNEHDEIFAKGYLAPPIKKKKDEVSVITIPKDLLNGLPYK